MEVNSVAAARIAVENLPLHDIGGYEWECYSCHTHFVGRHCTICNISIVSNDFSEFDDKGNPCDHTDLISRALVLKILGANSEKV